MNVIGVKLKNNNKLQYFKPTNFEVKVGNYVIVESSKGKEIGQVIVNKDIEQKGFVEEIKPVIRIATKEDIEKRKELDKKVVDILKDAKELVKKHKLDMKMLDCEYTIDQSKLLFYFTAEGRVDFRELVKEIAAIYKTRIELRQVGPRDEIRLFGCNGVCGKELCCNTFLNDFESVSMKMAKDQGVQLNPSKISGVCGKLRCCLKYEQNSYEESLKKLPKIGSLISTPEGEGIVEGLETLKENVRVRIGRGDESKIQYFNLSEINIIRNGKQR